MVEQIRSTRSRQRCCHRNEVEAKLDEICRDMVGLETILNENSQQRDKSKFEAGKK